MAPAAVRFHPAAAQEAESTYEWYAERNPAAAQGFREELRQAIDAVAASPRTWPRYGNRARRYVFPRYPFSLVYILRGDGIRERYEARLRSGHRLPVEHCKLLEYRRAAATCWQPGLGLRGAHGSAGRAPTESSQISRLFR